MPISSPVIVALDYPDAARALAMADQLDPARVRVKVGKEIFTRSATFPTPWPAPCPPRRIWGCGWSMCTPAVVSA